MEKVIPQRKGSLKELEQCLNLYKENLYYIQKIFECYLDITHNTYWLDSSSMGVQHGLVIARNSYHPRDKYFMPIKYILMEDPITYMNEHKEQIKKEYDEKRW